MVVYAFNAHSGSRSRQISVRETLSQKKTKQSKKQTKQQPKSCFLTFCKSRTLPQSSWSSSDSFINKVSQYLRYIRQRMKNRGPLITGSPTFKEEVEEDANEGCNTDPLVTAVTRVQGRASHQQPVWFSPALFLSLHGCLLPVIEQFPPYCEQGTPISFSKQQAFCVSICLHGHKRISGLY